MRRTIKHYPQIHPEVEHLEDLRFRKVQHDNAPEFCQGDAGEDGASHAGQGVSSSLNPRRFNGNRETVDEMRAEFHRYTHGHHKVY